MDLPPEEAAAASLCSLAPERACRPGNVATRPCSRLLTPSRRFDPDRPEFIDRPGIDRALLYQELQILETANRRLGVHGLVLQCIGRLIEAVPPAPLRVLDLATGVGDIPRAIAAWFRQRGWPIAITAVDHNPVALDIAQEAGRDWPEIQFEQHDVLDLPYPPNAFDLVLCSSALHHFTSSAAVDVLRRMQNLASVGYLVSDLRRNWLAIWITELVARAVIRSPIMRLDAPQSCRAAFTVDELQALAAQAGLRHFRIARHHGMFRMVLEGTK